MARWNATINAVELAESTRHWLTSVAGDPATNTAHIRPSIPSPAATRPRAVSHADRITSSALERHVHDFPGFEQAVLLVSAVRMRQQQMRVEGARVVQHAVRGEVDDAIGGRFRLPSILAGFGCRRSTRLEAP